MEYLPTATVVSRVGNDIICFRAANAHETFAVQTRTLFDEHWMHYSVLIFYVLIKCLILKLIPICNIMGISLKIRYFVNWMIPPWFPLADADIIRYSVYNCVCVIFAFCPHNSLIKYGTFIWINKGMRYSPVITKKKQKKEKNEKFDIWIRFRNIIMFNICRHLLRIKCRINKITILHESFFTNI